MLKKVWLPSVLLLAALAIAAFARHGQDRPWYLDERGGHRLPAEKIVNGYEAVPYARLGAEEYSPLRTGIPRRDLIGEVDTFGFTFYDYQHNGSIGKMVVLDTDGGLHFVYMKSTDAGQANRHMYYNFLEGGEWLNRPGDRAIIDGGTRSGYGCVDVLAFDQRAMPFYHVLGHIQNQPTYTQTCQSADFGRGFGAFSHSYPQPWPRDTLIWPKGCINRQNISHAIATEKGPDGQNWQRIAYWRGQPDREYRNWVWIEQPVNVDTTGAISSVAAASRISDRVVLAWHHNRAGANNARWEGFGGAWQHNNDIRYIVSENGRDFDWRNRMRSMTKILPVRQDLINVDLIAAVGDTFRPYTDVDIQFDPWDDNLYGAFAVAGFWENPEPEGNPVTGLTWAGHNYLLFWNGVRDTITFLADGWYWNMSNQGGQAHSRCGAWRYNCDRPSIAFDPEVEGKIYVVWVNFPYFMWQDDEGNFHYEEGATDTSAAGYTNAEIMVSISTDYGITWREPINITETRWMRNVAPDPGECMSENWPSVAVRADDALHIMYILDTDAGGLPQNEGTATNCPVIYHRVPLDELELNDPVELPSPNWIFHNYPAARPQIPEDSVRRNIAMPTLDVPVEVTATVRPGGNNQLTEVILLYALDDGEERVAQMSQVEGDTWRGTIPGQPNGTQVWYRIQATNSGNLSSFAPQREWRYGYVVRPEGGLQIRDIQFRPAQWVTDYSLYRGYEVTVTGIVTTPASFARTYGAYAIQDAAQGWSGVFLRGIGDDLNIGQRIRVTGTVMEQDAQDRQKWEFATYIQVSNYEVVGQTQPPLPIMVTVNDLTFARRAEELEGVLIRLLQFGIDDLTGFNPNTTSYWPITDATGDGWMTILGMTVNDIDNVGIRNWRHGTYIEFMYGVFTENYGRYAIAPRMPADIGQVGVRDENSPAPKAFALHPAAPNPFNAMTEVAFDLPMHSEVSLSVFDLGGRFVADIANGKFDAGQHMFIIDASDLPAGVYVMRLQAGELVAARKLVLVK